VVFPALWIGRAEKEVRTGGDGRGGGGEGGGSGGGQCSLIRSSDVTIGIRVQRRKLCRAGVL
jgi:hypothetical protein